MHQASQKRQTTRSNKKDTLTVEVIGNCGWEDLHDGYVEQDTTWTLPLYPLRDHKEALICAFQLETLENAEGKSRLTDAERHFKHLAKLYKSALDEDFGLDARSVSNQAKTVGVCLGDRADVYFARQRARIAAAKKKSTLDVDTYPDADVAQTDVTQLRKDNTVRTVPVPLAQQGPAVYAMHLLKEANATEEQIDAVSLFALSLQKKFDKRQQKDSILLPVAETTGNHEALWLGGGGAAPTYCGPVWASMGSYGPWIIYRMRTYPLLV